MSQMTLKPKRPPIDWEKIESEYRKGVFTVTEIGRAHVISRQAIEKRAKRDGWLRDLGDKINAAVARKVASPVALDESATIEAAATKGAGILYRHQERAARMLGATDMALRRLTNVEELISAASFAAGMNALASAVKTLSALERQAHGLSDESEGANEIHVTFNDDWARE